MLCVADVVAATCAFYERVFWAWIRKRNVRANGHCILVITRSACKTRHPLQISRRDTTPGSGNFCILTDAPIENVVEHLEAEGIEIRMGPGERDGAVGKILSVYFNDPDGNLVEISNLMENV